jgi:phosphatidate cytidylyltransferase
VPKRELFAVVALPIVLSIIVWAPPWVFLALVGGAVTIAGDELLGMARTAGYQVFRWLPLACLVGFMTTSWIGGGLGLAWAAAAVLMILPTAQLTRSDAPEGSLAGVSIASFTVLYLGIAGACLGWLRLLPNDDTAVRLILFFLGTIWIGDSGAYYVGSRMGRRRMSPRISPNKTWEGLVGGMMAALVAAAALKHLFGLGLGWPHVAALAGILAVATPVGDLIESQFKRDTGVKDSSKLLPGHGGLLDRTDSLLYCAPPVLAYLLVAGLVP